jgi:hypothetical protein
MPPHETPRDHITIVAVRSADYLCYPFHLDLLVSAPHISVADTTITHAMLPIVDCVKHVGSVRRIFQWVWRVLPTRLAWRSGPKGQTLKTRPL